MQGFTGAGNEAGLWVANTPTLYQGGYVSGTNNYGYYMRFGTTVIYVASITATAAGTASNPILSNIADYANEDLANAEGIGGAYTYYDAGSTIYTGSIYPWDVNTFAFQVDGNGAQLGSAPAITIASGDVLRYHVVYELA